VLLVAGRNSTESMEGVRPIDNEPTESTLETEIHRRLVERSFKFGDGVLFPRVVHVHEPDDHGALRRRAGRTGDLRD
jgi:hypothetical protein